MKKTLIRLSAAALCAACVFSLAACGGNNASGTGSGATGSAVSRAASAVVADEAVSSAAASGDFETVEDFINTDVMREQLDSMKESMASSGMDISITANGNQLVYTFTYQDTNGADPETLGSVLGTLTDSMTETFEGIASELAQAVGGDASVVVAYMAEDGAELYSREFFPAE